MKSDEKKREESARKLVGTKEIKVKGGYCYYDGHYPTTGKTIEELRKKIAEIRELEKHLTEWEKC